MTNTDAVDFGVLANSEAFRTFSRIMVNLTGLAVALYPPDGNHLHSHNVTADRNPLCAMIRARGEGSASCHACGRAHFAEVVASLRTVRYSCHAGFIDLAIPVMHRGSVVAIISSGQLLPAPHSDEGLLAFLPLCARFGIAPEELMEGYQRCTYMGEERTAAAIELLAFFAEHLCTESQRLSDAEVGHLAAAITESRRYIEEHLSEELSLPGVAAHVRLSSGYLSRQFERLTGCAFTTFVQQTRIEQVQHLLLHSSLPITEIALMNGFSSISQFNRTFRKHCGCTPRAFRARAPRGTTAPPPN